VAIAGRAYEAKRDSSGGLMLAHVVDVAQALGPAASPTALCAALLHDIPADTTWTVEDLSSLGVDAMACETIDILTRRSGETYISYIRRICDAPGLAGETARLITVADLTVSYARTNSDALRERYDWTLPLVQGALTRVR
jgi:hypothetical protein